MIPTAALPPVRLFLALWPPESVRDGIERWRGLWQWPVGAAPVPQDRLHITLHFLGDVPPLRLEELVQGLADVPCVPFALRLSRGQVWPPGIAVLLPEGTHEALTELHQGLGAALRRLDLPTEIRPYRPHMTLSRRAAGAVPPAQPAAAHWMVNDGYVLVRSLPGSRGYALLHRFT